MIPLNLYLINYVEKYRCFSKKPDNYGPILSVTETTIENNPLLFIRCELNMPL